MPSAESQAPVALKGSIITFKDSSSLLLTKVLGTGSYGAVYHAIPHSDTLDVACSKGARAVKVLRRPAGDAHRCRKAEAEVAHHRRVSGHPNVIALHNYIFDNDYAYCALGFVDGGDLFDAIADKAFCWQQDDLGIAHRDIKPENILCSADFEHFYLADFGLATNDRFSNEFNVGTLAYNAPELIVSNPRRSDLYETSKVDIWAVGCVFTAMISLSSLWRLADMSDDSYADYDEFPNYLRTVLPISRDANELVRRILEPKPSWRITLRELREQLQSTSKFFMNAQEIQGAPNRVRAVAERADSVHHAWQVKKASYAAIGQPQSMSLPPPAPLSSYESGLMSSSSGCSNLAVMCDEEEEEEEVPMGALMVSSSGCSNLADLCGDDDEEDVQSLESHFLSTFLSDDFEELSLRSPPSSPSWTETTPRAPQVQFNTPRVTQSQFDTPRPLQTRFATPDLSDISSSSESTLALDTPFDSLPAVAVELLSSMQQESALQEDSVVAPGIAQLFECGDRPTAGALPSPAVFVADDESENILMRGWRRAAALSAVASKRRAIHGAQAQAELRRRRAAAAAGAV